MSELIDKQAAIDAIEKVDWYHQNKNKDMVSGANSSEHQAWYKADDIYKTLEALPSTEAIPIEWIKEFADERALNDGMDCYWHFWGEDALQMIDQWRKENETKTDQC